jgi:FixJ family two-component response regulator
LSRKHAVRRREYSGDAGAVGFLVKPFSKYELKGAIDAALSVEGK